MKTGVKIVKISRRIWRRYVSFFDIDVPCEAKWSVWFDAYTDFDGHMVEYKKWLSKSRSRYFDS